MPDARKGERLVLVTQQKDATRGDFQAFAKSRGASELMVPAEVIVVDKLPLLGSGKIDNVGVAKLVREQVSSRSRRGSVTSAMNGGATGIAPGSDDWKGRQGIGSHDWSRGAG